MQLICNIRFHFEHFVVNYIRLRSDHMKQIIEQAYMQGLAGKPAGSRQSMAIMKKATFPAFNLGSKV